MVKNPNQSQVVLRVVGMHCGSCVARVEESLLEVPGVHRATVDLAEEKAVVEFDPLLASTEAMREAIRKIGFQASDTSPERTI